MTVECVIPQKFHRTIMGQRGSKVQEITKEWDVGIKFPDKPNPETESKSSFNHQLIVESLFQNKQVGM